MREIFFRGRRIDNKGWVEGDLIHSLGRTYCGIYAETLGQVDPATVGQFTGLHDSTKWEDLTDSEKLDFYHQHYVGEDGKSIRFQKIDDVKYLWEGKRIFEGDIIKTHYANTPKADFIEQVIFHNGRFCGMYERGKMKMWAALPDGIKRLPQDKSVYMEWCEVIGNIHDNPELLEV